MLNAQTFAAVAPSFTRGSAACWWDASGNLRTAGIDEPRFCSGGPDGRASKGLLLEPASQNFTKNPRGEQIQASGFPLHWAFTSGGGVVHEVARRGVDEFGIPFVDVRTYGVPTQVAFRHQFDTNTGAPAVPGEVWTAQLMLKLVAAPILPTGASAIAFQVEIRENSSGGSGLTQSGTVWTPSSEWQRLAVTRTVSNGAAVYVQPTMRYGMVVGVECDFTVRYGLSQIEKQPFPTSPILPPEGAPAATTRAADDCRIELPQNLSWWPTDADARTNYAFQSEAFDAAPWSRTGLLAFGAGSVANAAVAPDGTTTADKIVEDTSTGNHRIQATPAGSLAPGPNVFSVHLKAAERTKAQLQVDAIVNGVTSGLSATADLVAGTIALGSASGNLSGPQAWLVPLGNGWYRASLYMVCTHASAANMRVILNDGTGNSYAGDPSGTFGLLIWGAQMEQGVSVPTAYIPNATSSPVTVIDKARTNLLGYTDAFDNAYWFKSQVTVTPNDAGTTSPSGGTTADLVVSNTITAPHNIRTNAGVAAPAVGGFYTFSCYAKPNGNQPTLSVRISNFNNQGDLLQATCNVTAGTLVSTAALGAAADVSGGLTAVGNGWYRCWVTGRLPGVAMLQPLVFPGSTSGSAVGDDINGFWLFGAQLEPSSAGAAPTPYMRNSSSANPRTVLDTAPYSILMEYQCDGLATTSFPRLFLVSNSVSTDDYMQALHNGGGGRLQCSSVISGIEHWSSYAFTPDPVVANQVGRIGIGFAPGDIACAFDNQVGDAVSTPRLATGGLSAHGGQLPPGIDRLALGGGPIVLRVRSLELAPRRLSNAELYNWLQA